VRDIGGVYIEQRIELNGGDRPLLRNFSLLGVLLNYVQFESVIPGEVYRVLRSAYRLEQDHLLGMDVECDLLYDIPGGDLGTICFSCGVGSISNMFVVGDSLRCVQCIKGDPSAYGIAQVVPLVSRYQARLMGLL
jgi:hypothetical protein